MATKNNFAAGLEELGWQISLVERLKTHVFSEYKMESVFQKLGINEPQWIISSLVMNSDYSGHMHGQSFVKDLGVMRRCDAEGKSIASRWT
ncbi:hypothetical protein BGX26_012199 [Mortierella sp. AD094]|nr:hypothetical protein BGX26_012199 [Mortierella sp. AD094]